MTGDTTPNTLKQGQLQVYTGNGKGKTTAALGLAVRAAGAGLRVFIGQFLKGRDYSELHALERFSDLIVVRQFGKGSFVKGTPSPEDIAAAHAGFEEVRAAVMSDTYSLVIMDEGNVACDLGLITVEEVIALADARPAAVELVVTGRNAHAHLIERADLVTEMREIKHYYQTGLHARMGIEK